MCAGVLLWGGAWLSSAQAQRVEPSTAYGLGTAGVIPPRPVPSVDAFPFVSVFGPPAVNLGFPQPLGHQIIPTGPNGYIYRPVTDLRAFVNRATAALRAADYARVLVELEPVLAESPDDGNAWLLREQALFALARYPQAAEALHVALRLLPQVEWGQPVVRRRDYFRSVEEYAARLRALEAYVAGHPGEGAGHFLLGYHYGYLGRSGQAERELRAALRIMTGANDLAEALLAPTRHADGPSPGLPRDEIPLRRVREF